jgi:hypothetical protein
MKVTKDWHSYSPVSITLETYEEYRQLELMLHYTSTNNPKLSRFAIELLEALNGLEKN